MIALADANNFYCSAERVFNPSLHNKPIIVLSNNDGCVISRSNEAKQLGIKMAEPLFQIRYLCQKHEVKIFSSNYPLYGDMSQRIMQSLAYFSPEVEVYSIDEAFLDLSGFRYQNLNPYAREIKITVKKWTGIPIAVGIGPNKTLAKLANHIAKKIKGEGVFMLENLEQEQKLMQQLAVSEVWGIGKQSEAKLQQIGIFSIWDLYRANPIKVKQLLGLTGLKTYYALNNQIYDKLELSKKDKVSIGSSRSFSVPVMQYEIVASALSNYIMLAAQKLRRQNQYARAIQVYISTNRYNTTSLQYQKSLTLPLTAPSNDTRLLIHEAKKILTLIYRKGYAYQKVGVLLLDLTRHIQVDLFQQTNNKGEQLMLVVDKVNQQMGKNSLFFAAQGIEQHWKSKRDYQSPHYTTQWNHIPSVV